MGNFEARELTGNIFIYPLIRTKEELFSTTVLNYYKEVIKKFTDPKTKKLIRKLDIYVINANWYDVSNSGYIDAMNGHDPIPADETKNLGLIYAGGRITSGTSAKNGYYISFNKDILLKQNDISQAFNMGLGDPPTGNHHTAAFGDIGPLIINNLPYSSLNVYKKGTPKTAPVTGDPPPQYKNSLLKRSSSKFAQFSKNDASEGYMKGKTCIGISSSKVIIGVQQDGIKGPSLEGMRDYFITHGCKYAAFFDGSDSAMLFENGKFTINMGDNKDELCTAGIALVKFY